MSSENNPEMEKKLIAEAKRLKRFINSNYKTIELCAKHVGVSSAGLRSGYLSGRSLMGGGMLKKFIIAGLDPRYYLVGDTLPPDPTDKEIEKWIAYLKAELKHWTEYLKLWNEALEEVRNNMRKR